MLTQRTLVSLLMLLTAAAPLAAQSRVRNKKSAEPMIPATYSSRNFVVRTDLSAEESKKLLVRLETMLVLISKYWGQPNRKVIEMYVAKDITKWPKEALRQMDPDGIRQIQYRAGVTMGLTASFAGRKNTKSTVYAVADRGVPLHESVHAYCQQTFSTTGPLWYSEGMAEMGQYWKKSDASVNCEDYIVQYLKKEEPKSLNEIVNPEFEVTGDSWQNYAWRWALCHLLANNENYRDRFRPMGLAFLTSKKDVSFESTYGSMAEEIIFEYLLFLKNFDRGYRVDLCSWDWKTRPKAPSRNRSVLSKIDAARGWQASRALLEKDTEYDFSAEGTWRLEEKGVAFSGDGDRVGNGKLEGIIFHEHKLSEPFDLSSYGTFKAASDGHLFLRCKDEWNKIADNKGVLNVRVKMRDADNPLPRPDNTSRVVATSDDNKPTAKPPTDKNAKRAASKVRLGKLFLKRDKSKARKYFEEAIELAPDSPAAAEARKLLK